METKIMYGQEVAQNMLEGLEWDPRHTLYILSNQADPASAVYVRNKKKKCEEVGVRCVIYDISNADIERIKYILYDEISFNSERYYVIIQKPLPIHLREYEKEIDAFFKKAPGVDIDAFGGDLSTEFKTPATPLGVMKMLDYYVGVKNLDGLNAVVLGRSEIVGKPMAQLLLNANCTVTVCHSHTKNLKDYTRNADLIISAIGKPKIITSDCIGDNRPIIVDVGINRDENGKLCGDVDFENVKDKCSFISPVPKGVGVLTVASLVYKMGEKKLKKIV